MIHFYKLTVADIRRETPDCVSIALQVPAALADTFLFKQGQYLTLKVYINGSEVRRSYSICSSPLDGELRVAVKQVEGGVFSTWANTRLQVGDAVEAMPPIGKFFTELNESQKKSYVAFAAGSGITPVFSIIKTTLLTEPNSQFLLVYGNRNRQNIIFKEEIEALKNRFIHRFSVVHILSREKTETPLHHGRIDREKCAALFKTLIRVQAIDEFFICGPEEMMVAVKESLLEHQASEDRIHFELFTSHGLSKSTTVHKRPGEGAAHKSHITIQLDGAAFDFNLGFNDTNILDAALAHGADLPFSCKSGVCCTCRAKLVEGEVDMDINYGLEPDELTAGFILTCQSHPVTSRVVVDFDVK